MRAEGTDIDQAPTLVPAVAGGGPLAEALRRRLAAPVSGADPAFGADATVRAGVTIGAELTAGLDAVLAMQQRTLATGRAFLPCRGIGPAVEIGPLVLPGRPGCAACVDTARRRAAVAAGQVAPADEPFRRSPAPLYPLVADLALDLLRHRPDGAPLVRVVELVSLRVGEHRIHPVPDCPHCDRREDDSRRAAHWVSLPRPPVAAGALRAGHGPARTTLERELVDPRFGPVTAVRRAGSAPLAHVVADLAGPQPRQAHGRAATVAEARRLALIEAVERDSGAHPHARRTVVRGSHRQLADHSLDPVTLGLPDPALHDHPRFRLTPYSPDLPMWWVWGQRLATGSPVLVPEQVAYYGSDREPRVFSETSTGCAAGGCLEEAVLHGLLEVLERDAFLLCWYQRDPGVRLGTSALTDPVSAELASRIKAMGFELRLHDVTSDVGVPVVLAAAVAPAAPLAFLCAAGAHPQGTAALRAALTELAALLALRLRTPLTPADLAHREALLADPASVRTIADHVALHSHPRALPSLGWLLDPAGDPIPVAERFPAAGEGPDGDERPHGNERPHGDRDDLTRLLRRLVSAARAARLDPVVVRQTTARDHALGLEVVKVLTPGAVPLTVGGVHHRTHGLPRLRALPPVAPHPFP